MTDYKKIVDKCCLTVANEMNAWEIVTFFFPNCSFDKAECKSKRAGYSVYEVHQQDEDMWNGDYICNLGDRLEINFGNGFSKNIWIHNLVMNDHMKIKVFPRRYCINTAIKKLLNDSMYHDIFSFTEDSLIDYLPNWVFNDTWETDIVTKEGAAVYIHKQLWYISPMFYEIVEE